MNSRISTSPVHWPFLLLLLFCYPQATQAAEPVTRFNRISLEQGLSQASIRSIFIDSKGFLWFGTQDGLNRYDGYGFTIFRHDPKVKNSISNNWIRVITEDASGALWVGTDDGLNRYDHQSQGFVRFQHQPPNPHSLNHNTIRSIFQDSGGTLWIGTDGGLNRLNPALANPDNQHFSHFKHDSEDSRSLSHNTVKTIFEDSHGTLWFGTEAGGLNRFDRPLNSKNSPQQGFIHYQHDPLNPHSISHNNVKTMVEDAQGTLWIGTYVGGINKFDKETGRFSHYQHNPEDPHSLSDNNVLSSYLDSQGTLWFGTDGGGLNKYDQQHNRFVHFRHQPSDAHSLSADIIWSLGEDNNGALWVGTQTGGLNKLDLNNNRLNHFKHQPSDPYSLSSNTIKAIYKTQQDELWIGTNTNGLNRYDQQSSQFVHFKHQRSNPHSLSDDRVRAILQDSKGRLWIGTAGGGLNLFDHTNQRFKHWLNDKNDPDSLSNNRVIALLEDADGVLWVGTWGGGLNRFDPDSGKFSHYRHDEANPSSLSHNKISTVFEDSKGTLWVGTAGGGLNRFNRQSQQFDHYTHQASANHSISHNNITTIHEDRNGALWVSTFGGGLNKYETKKGRFVHYRQRHGIANDSIYGMLEDDSGNLWLSTNQGLTRFNPATRAYRNFDVFDGLQSNEFNFGAYFKGSDGELFFGGINGFNRFFPDQINDDRQIPPIVLTDFRLFNQSIDIAVPANPADSSANSANLSLTATTNDQQAPPFTLTKAIDELDLLTLNYQQNLMSFEFAALHFANPMQNQYAYFLEGWDKDWITTDASNRRATYTNIPQGKYTLRVKASNSQGYWDEQGKALTIIITPPPWKTSGAYVFYALLVSGLGWIFITVRAERSRRKNQQALNHHLKQVDKLKDQFLANTSHELRTPLNGIIGLTEALLDGVAGPLPHKANHNLALVVSSSKRLSNLVNDILDFAKLENHSVELHPIALDLHQIAENMLTLSRPLIGDKNLALINDVAVGLPAVLADEDRLAQIFHNLLGNAIKFTDKGYIIVSAIELDGWLNISIKDTGIGIAEDKFSAIFQSFEQIKGNTTRLHSGTGLGLAVSKQLVALHGGQIEVSSTIDEGSTFSFTLPTSDENPANNTGHQKVSHVHSFEHVDSTPAVEHAATEETHHPLNELADYDGSRFRLLLVDDEPVNLQVLHDHLSSQGYQLVEVSSGQQALQAIAQDGPFDLVLLDIMMPHMSGYQVCKTLRESHTINDLPIIFLTAKNQVTDLVQSFASGGNDYLSKPVSKHELLTRVATHLKLLDSMRHNAQSKDIRIDERTLALEQANRRMSTIIEISTQISGALDINKLLETAYKNIKELMDVDSFLIGHYQPDSECIVINLSIESGKQLPIFFISMDEVERPAVWCVRHQKPLIMNDIERDYSAVFGDVTMPAAIMGQATTNSLMYWPLMVSGHIIGVLSVQSKHKHAYQQEHQDIIQTLVPTLAIALDNANAYRKIEEKHQEIEIQHNELVATQQQLVQAEKMASLGTLTAGVAHEINNPTNFVHVSAQNLAVDLSKFQQFLFNVAGEDADEEILNSFKARIAPLHMHLDTIQNGTGRIKTIVQDLRAFSQLDSAAKKTECVTDLLLSTVHLIRTNYLESAEFITEFHATPQLLCYPAQLNQVFMNLIVNACDAIRDKQRTNGSRARGIVTISCRQLDQHIEITVKDNGCGMSEETKNKLFEPFYTTKDVGEGTGLGLSISFGIIQKHQGQLSAESKLGIGSVFSVLLPMADEA